ncbi:MAG: hypothetical protein E7159_04935 [Firmicutes bacterium]|nr:hypothetical protein [Bacillota bacterium]
MKIYKLLIEYSKYLKNNNSEVSLLLNLYGRLETIKNDPEYIDYFQLLRNYYYFYFYSPVITYDVINNIYLNGKFNQFITKNKCEKILHNEDIKTFVEQSKKVNNIIIKKISEFFSQEYKDSSVENYYCNSILNELGKANVLLPISIINGNSKCVSKYAENRGKIQKKGIFTYPYLITKEFIDEQLQAKIDLSIINSFETMNLIYSLLIKILYDVIFDKVIYLKKKEVKIILSKDKSNFKVIEFESKNLSLLIHELETIIIDENIYFPCSYTKQLMPENKVNYKCFVLNISDNTFFNFNILDSIELMSLLKKAD